jgi:hypothetical protein
MIIDLCMNDDVQKAISRIVDAHGLAIAENDYMRVEVSVWVGEDSDNENRIAYYEVSRRQAT